jgi:hypothetical protein
MKFAEKFRLGEQVRGRWEGGVGAPQGQYHKTPLHFMTLTVAAGDEIPGGGPLGGGVTPPSYRDKAGSLTEAAIIKPNYDPRRT